MAKATKFDRQEVIEKATNLYWEKGFHGTSMRDLQDVIDMRPGSIYAAFGSKEGLFKEALQQYASMGVQRLHQYRADNTSPLQALRRFIEYSVLETRQSAPSNMCMLAKTISELTGKNEELLVEAKRLLSVMEAEFANCLLDAQEKGELKSSEDPVQLARYAQVQIMGLRSYIRASDDEATVVAMIDDLFKHTVH